MHFPTRIVLVLAGFLAAGDIAAPAQSQSGTPLLPSGTSHDQPAQAQAAAPRQPVSKIERYSHVATPVIGPHGVTRPGGPAGKAASPATPAPMPPAPVQPPADVKLSPPDKPPEADKPEGSPAKLPRFASLRSDDVNMRAGPGTRYRIDWVYKRRDLPVEIEREFDVWRWVRDVDGVQGWVHQATLMGRRSFIVQQADAILRSEARESASAVAILKPGVIGRIRSCEASSDWCDVQAGSYRGYLRRAQFWGVLPDEAVGP